MTDAPLSAPLTRRLSFQRLPRGAVPALALTGGATAGVLAALPFTGLLAAAAGLLAFAVAGGLAVDRVAAFHRHDRFGWGNGVTVARAGGTAVFVALAVEPGLLGGGAAWGALVAALVLLALDGIDGRLARGQGLASAFGARFDMEVDALLILALSALAFGLGKAGLWVFGIGLLRYLFVAAGWLAPRLARPLAPSGRRRAVCAVQIVVLSLLLAPPLVPPLSAGLAAAAFAALVVSFAIDTAWLLRAR